MTRFTNQVKGEVNRTPVSQLLLCLIPFYGIYWTFETAKRVEKLGDGTEKTWKLSTLSLILSCVFPIAASILIQDETNRLSTQGQPGAPQMNPNPVILGNMSFGLAAHTLLMVLTFGIYNLIWIYRVTGYLNQMGTKPDRSQVASVLLSLFIPIYQIYWYYRTSERLDEVSKVYGNYERMAAKNLIFSVINIVIPAILIQDRINQIIEDVM